MQITASKLYDYIQCPHRVWRDVHGPQDEKIQETNAFVQLLWDKGVKHEKEIVSALGDFLDVTEGTIDTRIQKTIEAMKSKSPLIFQGVLKHENLLGIPDLLKKLPDDSYIPIDIKSGTALEGMDEIAGDEGKPKKHYAAQLCLYNDLLKKTGFAGHDLGKIIDINKEEVVYDLSTPISTRSSNSWWEYYEYIKADVNNLIRGVSKNKPALAGKCKLCPWLSSCKKWCEKANDLTNVFYVGRSYRDRINDDLFVEDIDNFIELDVEEVMGLKENEKKLGNKEFLHRIGKPGLKKAIDRAKIRSKTKKPVIYEPIVFPDVKYELFFDIEDDPTQEFVYLHGVYERSGNEERFIDFTATELSSEVEKQIWQDFWKYIKTLPKNDFVVYYYSPYERTVNKRLFKKYSEVISEEQLEEFFDSPNVIDLYSDIIYKHTDWPLSSYSIKEIAGYVGFEWRDETPSGALSIQWFNEFLDSGDENIMKRILDYNEDDCKAMMVVKDYIKDNFDDLYVDNQNPKAEKVTT